MDGIKVAGLVIKSVDYGDNDKLLSIFTAEYGRITALIKGVKKATAKLKFAAQPFCFGDFMFSKRADRYIVTGCSEKESFFAVRESLEGFYAASAVAEVLDTVSVEGNSQPQLFVKALRTLQKICYSQIDKIMLTVKFLTDVIDLVGYKIQLEKCTDCKGGFVGDKFFDFGSGGALCSMCARPDSFQMSTAVHNALRLVLNTPNDRLDSIKLSNEILKDTIKLLADYCVYLFDRKIKSLSIMLDF